MAGLCNISFDNEHLSLMYAYAHKSLEELKEKGEDFNFKTIASKFYNSVKEGFGETTAAAHVQLLPSQFIQASMDNTEIQPKNFINEVANLLELNNAYTSSIENVIKDFKAEEPVNPKELKESGKIQSDEAKDNPVNIEKRHEEHSNIINNLKNQQRKLGSNVSPLTTKKTSPISSTGQQSITNYIGQVLDIEDPRVSHIYDFLSVLNKESIKQNVDFDELTIGGHTGFRVTPIAMNTIDTNDLHNRYKDFLNGKDVIFINKRITEDVVKKWRTKNIKLAEEGEVSTDPNKKLFYPEKTPVFEYAKELKKHIGSYHPVPEVIDTAEDKAEFLKTAETIINEKVELFITDLEGNILYFDENNNVVDKDKGRPIYYPIASVAVKEGRYTLTNPFDENRIMNAEELAKYRHKGELSSGEILWDTFSEKEKQERIEEADVELQGELELLYNIVKGVKEGATAKPLKINGINTGSTSILFTEKTDLSDINWDASKLKKSDIHLAKLDNPIRKEFKGLFYLRNDENIQSIPLERKNRTVEEAERIADLILTDNLKEGFKKVTEERKTQLLEYQVYTSTTSIQYKDGKLYIKGKKVDTTKDKAKVKQRIVDVLTELDLKPGQTKESVQADFGDNAFRKSWAKPNFLNLDETKDVELFTIEGNKLTVQYVPLNQYIADNTFGYIKINKEKAIPVLNGYISFQSGEELFENIENVVEAAEGTYEAPTSTEPTNPSEQGLDDMLSNPEDLGLFKGKSKLGFRFDKLMPGHKAKADKAEKWYKESGLAKHFPLEKAFGVVNSNAYAKFTKHGITLINPDSLRGASGTDIYHEAWHGFSQFFLTIDQKIELYNEVAKTKLGQKELSSFAKAKNKNISDLTDYEMFLAMEELLAEDFRKYMLSGGNKVLKQRPKANTIFRKILDFLKEFLGLASNNHMDLNTVGKVKELYDNLRLGEENLIEYTASELNMMPGWKTLNKGVITPLDPEDTTTQISSSDALVITESIDSLMSDIIDEYVAKKGSIITSSLYSKPEMLLPALYSKVKEKLQNRLSEVKKDITDLDKTKLEGGTVDLSQYKVLNNQAKILSFAIEQFGEMPDWIDALSGVTNAGVVGYHINKSKYITFTPKELDRFALEESGDLTDEQFEQRWDKSSSDFSMTELASSEIKSIVFSAKKYNEKGELEKNSLGFNKLLDFNIAFSTLITLTKEVEDPAVMETRMLQAAAQPENKWIKENILHKLGTVASTDLSSFLIWTKFWQTFYKHDIALNQLTISETRTAVSAEDVERTYGATYGRAHTSNNNVKRKFIELFKLERDNPFIIRDKVGVNKLDIEAILNKYSKIDIETNKLQFLRDIGLPISNNDNITDHINKNVNAEHFYKKLKDYNNNDVAPIYDIISFLEKPLVYNVKQQFGKLKTDKLILKSEHTNLNHIFDAEIRYSGKYPNNAVINAKGSREFEQNQLSSLTRMVEAINESVSFDHLVSMPHMNHLMKSRNFFSEHSKWLNSIYNMSQDGGPKRKGVTLKVDKASGVQSVMNDQTDYNFSTSSSQADKYSRLLNDIYGMLMVGRPSTPTPADKGTVLSVYISGTVVSESSSIRHLYVDTTDFMSEDQGEQNSFSSLVPYIQAEINRIKYFEENPDIDENVPGVTRDVFDKKGNIKTKASVKEFQAFDGMFSDKIKSKLTKLGDTSLQEYLEENEDFYEEMFEEFRGFLESELEDTKQRLGDFTYFDGENSLIKNHLHAELRRKNAISIPTGKYYDKEYKQKEIDAIINSFNINYFIHNIELTGLIYGDLYNYKDFSKRMPGSQSDGYQHRDDAIAREFINQLFYKDFYGKQEPGRYQTYRKLHHPNLEPRVYNGTLNTAILKETKLKSVYLEVYEKAFREYYTNLYKNNTRIKNKKALIDKKVKDSLEPYANMEEGDGQGWITFDGYRMMSILQSKWNNTQESLYQDIIAGKDININKVSEYFPPMKYQYWGPLKTKGIPLYAFHKFSLMPLIPNVIKDKNLQILHDNLVKQDIDYALHGSGSKMVNIYGKDNKGNDLNELSPLYENYDKDGYLLSREMAKDVTYTKNVIFTKYLKDQLDINKKYKNKSTFSSQIRKIIMEGSVENGIPTDFMNIMPSDFMPKKSKKVRLEKWEEKREKEWVKHEDAWDGYDEDTQKEISSRWKKVREWETNIRGIIEKKKEEILEELGTSVKDLRAGKANLESISEFIKDQLARQDMGIHELEMVGVTEDKSEFLYDLSISPSAEKIERVLTAYINNILIRTKVNGEPLVLAASTMMENQTTISDIEKYGNKDLKSYEKVYDQDGNFVKTKAAEAKIALQGEFLKLLNLKHLDGNLVGVRDKDGNLLEDESIKRLNELIQDEEWRSKEENIRLISISGVRIPVQGINSGEFFTVKEFLPKSAGNIIIPPSEIVAKSGSDFDIDKLTLFMPRISIIANEGSLLKESKTRKTKTQLSKEISNLKKKKREITKEYNDKIRDLMKDPKNELYREINKKYLEPLKKAEENLAGAQFLYDKALTDYSINPDYVNVLKRNSREEKLRKAEEIYYDLNRQFKNEKSAVYEVVSLIPEVAEAIKRKDTGLSKINLSIERTLALKEGLSSKALENKLLTNLIDFFSDPENFISLVTPLDAGIVKEKALDMGKMNRSKAGSYNPLKGWKKQRGGERKIGSKISPTKLLTASYNNVVHEENSVAKDALGIGAVANTFNIILNRVRAHMNPFSGFKNDIYDRVPGLKSMLEYSSIMEYKNAMIETGAQIKKLLKDESLSKDQRAELEIASNLIELELRKEAPVRLLLEHNTLNYQGQEVISLSHMYDVTGQEKIANIISQLMNGWVDVAKGAWVFDVQGTKLMAGNLLYLVQTGVPFDTIVDFLSNPLVVEYIDTQIALGSPAARLNPIDSQVLRDSGQVQDAARKRVIEKYEEGMMDTDKYGNMKLAPYQIVATSQEKVRPQDVTPEKLKDIAKGIATEKEQFKAFLHFLEVEQQASAITQLQTTLTYDTSTVQDLFEATLSISKYESLLNNSLLPSRVSEDIVDQTIIGAFKVQDFMLDLWAERFPLRNHSTLHTYLKTLNNNRDSRNRMKTLFGTVDKFASNFRNDLVVHSFIQQFKKFNINDVKSYKGIDTIASDKNISDAKLLKRGAGIINKDGQRTLYINKEALETQFRLKSFTDTVKDLTHFDKMLKENVYHYQTLGVAPLHPEAIKTDANEYYRFVIEREILRDMYSPADILSMPREKELLEKRLGDQKVFKGDKSSMEYAIYKEKITTISQDIYEEWLRDEALTNILNEYQLFRSDNTIADKIVDFKYRYPQLEQLYPLIDNIENDRKVSYVMKKGIVTKEKLVSNNFKLRQLILDGDMINAYHENFKELADPLVMKVTGEPNQAYKENLRLSKFFENLPIYAFLQSGLNVTDKFSMTRVIPFEKLSEFLVPYSKAMVEELDKIDGTDTTNPNVLNRYYRLFVDKHSRPSKRTGMRNRYYYQQPSAKVQKNVESVGLEETNMHNVFSVNTPNTKKELLEIIESNPDTVFVIEKGEKVDTKGYVEGLGPIDLTDNMMFLTTRKFSLNNERAFFTPEDHSKNKDQLIQEVNKIYDLYAEGSNKIAFINNGYGEYLINNEKTDSNLYDAISQELYTKFNFLNKNAQYMEETIQVINEGGLEVTDSLFEDKVENELEDILKILDNCK